MQVTHRAYRCQCGQTVFFGNSQCLACGTALGYEPERGLIVPLQPAEAGLWRLWAEGEAEEPAARYARCANFDTVAGCNWLCPMPAPPVSDEPAESAEPIEPAAPVIEPAIVPEPPLCAACRLNRIIPDLSDPDNQRYWNAIERAKRRLVSSLIALGLPLQARHRDDPVQGLVFDFLRPAPGEVIWTGHADGVITLNVEEADPVKREAMRAALHEPYRTLLGHFRHEIGHYYWDRLIRDSAWLEPWRTLFGDERMDYAAALQLHYQQGPRPDWSLHFISGYASCHPWEDWAETWAHYLHMLDTVDTALSFRLDLSTVEFDLPAFTLADLWQPEAPGAATFLELLNSWLQITSVMNQLARSMGQPDFYPFVLPTPVVAKLHFIDCVVRSGTPPPVAEPTAPVSTGA